MNQVTQLRQPTEWWVVRTAEGRRAFPYRANSRTPAIGPFMTQGTANMKIAELEQADRRRRVIRRTAAIAAGVAALTATAMQVVA